MAERSILIIGAGIGGLSLGCYAQMNGYRARILEMSSRPGGVCTSWVRDGYTFDGCIHNLAGSSPQSAFHHIWRELGVVPQIEMRPYDELVRVERSDGEALTVYTDLDRLEAHLKQLSPSDGAVIDDIIGAARRLAHFDLLGLAVSSPLQRISSLAYAPACLKWGRITLKQYASRFTDPFLRRAFPTLVYDWPDQPMLILLSFLGRCGLGDLGWPVGGSAALAGALERRFRELGGDIEYDKTVQSIVVDNDQATGVRTSDGGEERGDIVVSNANGHATIFRMLGGRYTSRAIRAYYAHPEDRIEMGIHVSLGLARDLSGEPHAIVLPLDQPVLIDEEMRHRLYVQVFGFDPSLAPPGKSVLKVVMATSFARWEETARDTDRYQAEKQRIANTVISLLEKRFPGLRQQIEAVDVATPITTSRYTGNAHGYRASASAMAGALFTGRRLSQTLPGLRNFYMVGQWAGVPGVSMVAAMGRDVVREICRHDGRNFATNVAT
jgi:phytoene dehydrogenase-like protein